MKLTDTGKQSWHARSLATISIRLARLDDASSLARLATLDSAAVPVGRLLLAERDGRLAAALSLQDGTAIADPFTPTAELLTLLRVRASRIASGNVIKSRWRRRAHAA